MNRTIDQQHEIVAVGQRAGSHADRGAVKPRMLALSLIFLLIALVAPLGASAQTSATRFYISGGGFGHGIGMSAYGAAGYAQHGWGYQAILSHYYTGTTVGTVPVGTQVTVLLNVGSATFSGATTITGSKTALKAGSKYSVVVSGSKLALVSGAKRVGTFKAPLVVNAPGGKALTLSGVGRYWGSFVFTVVGGTVQTVNRLGIDQYADGVISKEMVPSWPLASLEAFAAAIRSVALTDNVAPGQYDVYPDTRSQVYGGVNGETALGDAAVAATSRQVVEYAGQPIMAFFFTSSGGYTESIQNVWPGALAEPYLKGVPDPYDNSFDNPYYHWSRVLTLNGAAGYLGGRYRGSLLGIKVLRHGVSPRIIIAQVVGTKGSSTLSGGALASLFGLLSTNVSFTTISARAGVAAGGVHTLTGTVFPAPTGSTITLQRRLGSRWSVVSNARMLTAYRFVLPVTAAGVYRVGWGSVSGPPINVG